VNLHQNTKQRSSRRWLQRGVRPQIVNLQKTIHKKSLPNNLAANSCSLTSESAKLKLLKSAANFRSEKNQTTENLRQPNQLYKKSQRNLVA
jgi:hypothetical protein